MGPGGIGADELKEADFDLPAERGTRAAINPVIDMNWHRHLRQQERRRDNSLQQTVC